MNRGRHKKQNKSFLYKFLPPNVVDKMLNYQQIQTGKKDITIFEDNLTVCDSGGGFIWDNTTEGWGYWNELLTKLSYSEEFEKEQSRCTRVY